MSHSLFFYVGWLLGFALNVGFYLAVLLVVDRVLARFAGRGLMQRFREMKKKPVWVLPKHKSVSTKKKLVVALLFSMLVVAGFALLAGNKLIPVVKAGTVETTRTFSSLSYDGYIQRFHPIYSTAHDDNDGDVFDWPETFEVGQETGYSINRGFTFFDTTVIPDDANITAANLSLYITTDVSTTDFNVTIQNGQPTYPHIPLDNGDYYYIRYSGDGGSRNTSTLPVNAYWNITLNADGRSWINVEGTTKLCLISSEDIADSPPTTVERVVFYSYEKGEAYAPVLYVTYEVGAYRYLVHGPFFESGQVAPTTINCTLSIENTDPFSFVLNGTSGTADMENINLEQRAVCLVWNFSSYMNYSRTYFLTDDTFEEIWLYIPNVAIESVNIYSFVVTDFVGITNAYLETVHTVGGQNRIVERQSLAVINAVPFWLVWAKSYDIRLVCDQGTNNFGAFIAGAEMTQGLIIIEGMFPTTYPGLNVTCRAKRMNATWIQANYTDNQELTSWVKVTIQYKSGHTWLTAYSTNNTGNTQQINWYSAESSKDYLVSAVASRSGTTSTWSFSCPKPPGEDNPWEGLEGLGTWPIPAKQIIGLFLVLAVFAVFSYANMPLGCILGCITAGILTYIGWLDIAWDLIALGFAIGILAAIAKAKKEEREI